MTSAPDDPQGNLSRVVPPGVVPEELTKAVSRFQEVVASSRIQHSYWAEQMKSVRDLQARIASVAAPFQEIRDVQEGFARLGQGQRDELARAARVLQENFEAVSAPHKAYLAQIDGLFAPYREAMDHVQQLFAPVSAAQARWQEAVGPIQQVSSYLASLVAPYRDIEEEFRRSLQSPEMRELFERANRDERVRAALDQAGWLPHPTIPDDVVLGALEGQGGEAVSSAVELYLQENWGSVAEVFRDRFRRTGVDDETIASMDEALLCRGRGLHRATCRTIFPEIERVVRLRMPPPNPTQMASLRELREAMGELPCSALGYPGTLWMPVFEHVQEACYAKVDRDVAEEDFPLPNRHAVAHGRLPYSSPRDSMNSLVIADFMLNCIGSIVACISASGDAVVAETEG